jgi:predicted lipoprotein with Yx(FWY)xxD motif
MIGKRRFGFVPVGLVALSTLGIAACGSSGSNNTSPQSPSSSTPAQSAKLSGTVDAATSGLGKILVNSRGRSLYLFQGDTGMKSACSGACAAAWPPLLASGKPSVGGGVQASLIGTSKRSNGTEQVTYNGHPLYLFTGDQSAGQTNGQGSTAFGASWYVLSPAGNQITASPSSSGGGSNSTSTSNPY